MIIKIKIQSYNQILLDIFIENLMKKIQYNEKVFLPNNYDNGTKEFFTLLKLNNFSNKDTNKIIKRKIVASSLPTIKKKITVLRSAHVHKKSREQFLLKVYSKCIFLRVNNLSSSFPSETINIFIFEKILKYCQFNSAGIFINFSFQTKYYNLQ